MLLGGKNFISLPMAIPVGFTFKMVVKPLAISKSPVVLLKVKSIVLLGELSINSILPDIGIICTFLAIGY